MKTALALGGGGFIGSHLAKRLKSEGYWVRVVDIEMVKYFDKDEICDEFIQADLRDPMVVSRIMKTYGNEPFDEVYQHAAQMGGAAYIFTGENDADIMYDSGLINFNVAKEASKNKVKRLFYSSSACIYPQENQQDPNNPNCKEDTAFPANPDSAYGHEKIFSEIMYDAFRRNYGLNVRIARYHNIFGECSAWIGGKEKSPAAMCRKVAETKDGGEIEVWGNGQYTRSFLYIDECLEATLRLMRSDCQKVLNIGSEEMVTINQLAQMAIDISGKDLRIRNIDGQEFIDKYGYKCPTGVKGRNSDNTLYRQEIGWEVSRTLREGMKKTYKWVEEQVKKQTI